MDVRIYVDQNGKEPFTGWLKNLRDRYSRDKMHTRIDRLQLGNTGDTKSLGNGLYEMRIHSGPGYRVYFGQVGICIALLLCGGNKTTQQRDITLARS